MKNLNSNQKNALFAVIILLISIITPISGFGNSKFAPPPPPPPTNDDCSGAIFITPGVNCNYTTYSNYNATASTGVPAPGCGAYSGGDVWFAVIVPFSGHLIIDAQVGTMTNGGMALYSGSCSGLTLIACNDNKAPGNLMPQIDKIGLPAFLPVFIRFWGNGANNYGTFNLCITVSNSQPPCTNLGFENDYTGWYPTLGQQYDGVVGAGTPVYYPLAFNSTANPNFAIMTTASGNDPYGGFPCVLNGTKSLRIGETALNQTYDGASIEQTFTVGANTNFIYNYAVVLQNPQHPFYEQPFFQADLYDQNGNPITCGIYSVALPNIAFTLSSVGSQTYYKAWTPVSVNLSAYTGQNVTIKFTISDCSLGGHWGYAYLDCSCAPFEIAVSSDTICAGQPDTLRAPPGALSYLWTPGGATTQQIVVYPTTTTTYSCSVTTQGNTPCPSTIMRKVVIDPGFTATASSNAPICPTDTLKLFSGPAGMTSYKWIGPNGFADSVRNTFIPNVTSSVAGTYSAILKSPRGCVDTATTIVALRPLPTIITNNGSACIGDTAIISASGGTKYLWNPTNDTTASINVAPLTTTTYQVKVTDQFGCKDTSSATAVINPLPTIQLTGITTICNGDSTTLTASGGVSYLWDSIQNTASIKVGPTSLSTYQVEVTDGNGCSDTSSISVDVISLPIPIITQDVDTICKGTSTTLNASGGSTYLWSTGETTPTIMIFPYLTSFYTVTATNSLNNINCSVNATAVMNVRNCNMIYVPNSFSPFGLNTVFKPLGEFKSVNNYSFQIFNRWGQMVFETNNPDQGWDGKYNGEFVQTGAYIYYLKFDNVDEKYEKVGTVTILF